MNRIYIEISKYINQLSLLESISIVIGLTLLALFTKIILRIRYEVRNKHKEMIHLGIGLDKSYRTGAGDKFKENSDQKTVKYDGRYCRNEYRILTFNPKLSKVLLEEMIPQLSEILKKTISHIEVKYNLFGKRYFVIHFSTFSSSPYYLKDCKSPDVTAITSSGGEVLFDEESKVIQNSGKSASGKTNIINLQIYHGVKSHLKHYSSKPTVFISSVKKNDFVFLKDFSTKFNVELIDYENIDELKKLLSKMGKVSNIIKSINSALENVGFNDRKEFEALKKKGMFQGVEIESLIFVFDEIHALYDINPPQKIFDIKNQTKEVQENYAREQELYKTKIQIVLLLQTICKTSRYLDIYIILGTHSALESKMGISKNLIHQGFYSQTSEKMSQSLFNSRIATDPSLTKGKLVTFSKIGDPIVVKSVLITPEDFKGL